MQSEIALQIPKAYQELFLPADYKVYYGGRGSGKSESFARALLVQGMQQKHLILCTREFQASMQDSVHRMLATTILNNGLADQYEVLQSVIRHRSNGTEFIFKGLRHNITEIKGLHGITRVWAEESENISYRSWEVLMPTIRTEGAEIWVSFNTKNPTDPTYEIFVKNQLPNSIVRKVSFKDNPFFPEFLRKQMEYTRERDPEKFSHVWMGNFDTRRTGAVYGRQIAAMREDGRITKVPYNPGHEVFTAWDLGYGDATSIWWLQWVGRELRWLECYENSGEMLGHYVEVVKARKYNYAQTPVYLPHDGGAGNIRGDSVANQLRSMGLDNIVIPRETDITPGLELMRQTLAFSVMDADNCKDGIHALENYGYEWDEDRNVFKPKPLHNWASHYADAARYAAQAAKLARDSLTKLVVNEPGSSAFNAGVW
ncbi:MAG: PBSX family phage terminase large subunit [Sulfuricellaceae bacterium]